MKNVIHWLNTGIYGYKFNACENQDLTKSSHKWSEVTCLSCLKKMKGRKTVIR